MTDANLILGRLIPEEFPKIFGPNEDQELDLLETTRKFTELTETINSENKECGISSMTIEEVASGFIKVANETMCRPIRTLTEAKGKPAANHILACFGGAGAQHACAIARILGIEKVVVHNQAPVLSAFGLAIADVVVEVREPCSVTLEEGRMYLEVREKRLLEEAANKLLGQFKRDQIEFTLYLNLRFSGTDTAFMISDPLKKYKEKFVEKYKQEFGFVLDRDILVDDIRVRATGKTAGLSQNGPSLQNISGRNCPEPKKHQKVYFDGKGFEQTPVYDKHILKEGDYVEGPAIIIDSFHTILVEPDCCAIITQQHTIIDIKAAKFSPKSEKTPIEITVFGHRFMGIAEQMGEALRKTSISTNIKERLDFSCAIFGPDGSLIANAPHIPVHLGSLSHAVKYQLEYYKGDIKDGDVIITNHPKAGGSHLPGTIL